MHTRRAVKTRVSNTKEWCGYPIVKKNLKICLLVLTESTNVTDRQAHRQTDAE